MMAHSMTAYINVDEKVADATLQWEIRSVNHRYLELAFRLPEVLKDLEFSLRESARDILNRGKVDCSLKLEWHASKNLGLTIDHQMVDTLINACEQIRDRIPGQSHSLSPLDILRWPSVTSLPEKDVSELKNAILISFAKALESLLKVRAREGEKLAGFIRERLNKMDNIAQSIKKRMPEIHKLFRQKLKEKLDELSLEIDKNRFEQELLYLMQKMDISEELDRLSVHLKEVERLLKEDKAIGRRLDFLMQELNRETNTIASKANDHATIQDAIELKVLIEEMREQIQNLE